MLVTALTGNIGSGKSTVASVFQCLGIPVYHADAEAKRMYQREEVLQEAVSMAGEQILGPDGRLRPQALAEVAFREPLLLRKLNRLIHPLVMEDFRAWVPRQRDAMYVIMEAAIIFESGLREQFDKVIHVSCPDEIAIRRIEKRDHVSREKILQRMKFQFPDREKADLADFVILNDGSTLVIPQVLAIHRTLTS